MCGTYRNTLYDITLATDDGRTFLTYEPRTELFHRKDRVEVVRHGDRTIITAEPKADGHHVLALVGSDGRGRANFLHNGAAAWRIA